MATLKEVIEATKGNYGVKIGTWYGAGYIWCGKSADIMKNYGVMDRRARAKHTQRIKNCKTALNKLFSDCPTIGKYAQENYRHDKPFGTVEGYLEWLKPYFGDLEKAVAKLQLAETRAESYVAFEDREVKSLYKSIDEKNTAIIIVDGNESGDAWTTAEFEALQEQGYEGRQAEEEGEQ